MSKSKHKTVYTSFAIRRQLETSHTGTLFTVTHANLVVETTELPFDPLLASAKLPFTHTVFPLGFRLTIRTNHRAVLDHADLSWGTATHRFDRPGLEFHVLVSESGYLEHLSAPVFRAQRNLMTVVADANHFGACELGGTFGFVHTSAHLLGCDDFFRYHFLEGLVYSLLDTCYLATLHAACVSYKGQGVLLVGESGAGKSSFAYGCARRGWTYTSDDASSLILDREDRLVLGNPNGFRFRPSVASLFPELQGHIRQRNGKPTLEIRSSVLPHILCAEQSFIEYVIFLRRRSDFKDGPTLNPVSQNERFRRLFEPLWPAELPTSCARRGAIARLSEATGFELQYHDLHSAIDVFERLIS